MENEHRKNRGMFLKHLKNKKAQKKRQADSNPRSNHQSSSTETISGITPEYNLSETTPKNSLLSATLAADFTTSTDRMANGADEIEARLTSVAENSEISSSSDMYTVQNKKNTQRDALLKLHSVDCSKNPGHESFIPVHQFGIQHLPPSYQQQIWVDLINLKAFETVHIRVSYTSQARPDDFGLPYLKGTTELRYGSGTAFIGNMDKTEVCTCSEVEGPHKISGRFKVMTVAHVVFNDDEAQSTTVEFFYDDEGDRSTIVRAHGVRVCDVDIKNNRSVFECQTHDLNLFQRLLDIRKKREQLVKHSLPMYVNAEPMVILISHPHGLAKKISVGKLLDIREEGNIRTTKNGIDLIGCLLSYDTPTCPGSGGGSINLIGKGEVCSAFAPHSASKNNSENISGLGWTKYNKAIQLRASNI